MNRYKSIIEFSIKYLYSQQYTLLSEFENPSEEFIRAIGKQVYDGVLTQNIKEKFGNIISIAINEIINEKINKTLLMLLLQMKKNKKIIMQLKLKKKIMKMELSLQNQKKKLISLLNLLLQRLLKQIALQ